MKVSSSCLIPNLLNLESEIEMSKKLFKFLSRKILMLLLALKNWYLCFAAATKSNWP